MAQIGFIGTGEIAAAMVTGLTGQGHQIFVSKRGKAIAAKLAQFDDVTIADNDQLVANCDVVILCLLADVAKTVLPDLPFRADQQIISVMVDVSYDQLKTLTAPATDIAITIPLPHIATGGCPLPCYPKSKAVARLFGHQNPVFSVATETGLNAHFAATAMASVTFAQAKVAVDWLGEQTGDTAAAEAYLIAMLAGFYQGLETDGRARLDAALAALSTAGGLNATLRAHMKQAGTEQDLRDGLDGFKPRLGLL